MGHFWIRIRTSSGKEGPRERLMAGYCMSLLEVTRQALSWHCAHREYQLGAGWLGMQNKVVADALLKPKYS